MQRQHNLFRGRKWLVTAVSCLFLVGLAACGGGGGGATGTTPEMSITPAFAEAMDITGMETVEGRIESADDEVLYSFRLDEPNVVTLRATSEADLKITLYDSEGNVLTNSVGGGQAVIPSVASGSGAPIKQIVPAAALAYPIGTAGLYYIGVAGSVAGSKVATAAFALTVGVTIYAVKKIRDLLELEIGLGNKNVSRDLKRYFDGEESVEVTFEISPFVDTKWGRLTFTIDGNHVMRVSSSAPTSCGNQADNSLVVTPTLKWSWQQEGVTVSPEGEGMPVKIIRAGAPRRKNDRPYEIAMTVQEGESETVTLTEEIEDPDGEVLTFTHGTPPADSGLSVTRNGARLMVTARNGAKGGTITVTATDPDGECWNFPLQVRVGEENGGGSRMQPGGLSPSPSISFACLWVISSPDAGGCSEFYSEHYPRVPDGGCTVSGATLRSSCPRSRISELSGISLITQCAHADHAIFVYGPSVSADTDLGVARRACGGRFSYSRLR